MSTGLVYGINQNPKDITKAPPLFLVNKPNKKIIIIDLI